MDRGFWVLYQTVLYACRVHPDTLKASSHSLPFDSLMDMRRVVFPPHPCPGPGATSSPASSVSVCVAVAQDPTSSADVEFLRADVHELFIP